MKRKYQESKETGLAGELAPAGNNAGRGREYARNEHGGMIDNIGQYPTMASGQKVWKPSTIL